MKEQFKIIREPLPSLMIIESKIFKDERGHFIKIFNKDFFKNFILDIDIEEIYFSINKKNVIRGMHFQLPPDDHEKIVYVSKGSILDVVLDLRKGENFGKFHSEILSENNSKFIFIPKGFAHGFLSLEEDTIVNYAQSTVYSPKNDYGVNYASFGFQWKINNPILSERDRKHPSFQNFISPF